MKFTYLFAVVVLIYENRKHETYVSYNPYNIQIMSHHDLEECIEIYSVSYNWQKGATFFTF